MINQQLFVLLASLCGVMISMGISMPGLLFCVERLALAGAAAHRG